jgi:NAD(P)H-hydrate epimerase
MNELPQKIYRASQVRKLDQLAIANYELPGSTLMERAGKACFDMLVKRWPNAKRVAVLCGTGNNGGDGFVIARLLKEAGIEVAVYQAGDKQKIGGDALVARNALINAGVEIEDYKHGGLSQWDIIVDALLGIGIEGNVTGVWLSAIQAINRSGRPVLAVDVPSGLHADTGCVMGDAVKSAMTVTFIGMKQGCFTADGPEYCGVIQFDDLSVPQEIYESTAPSARRLDTGFVTKLLRKRPRNAHKGHFGHVLVVGGDLGMSGAVRLAAEAAARVGAGLVSIATRVDHAYQINLTRPELMCHAAEDTSDLAPLLEKASVVAVGPGLGQSDWAKDILAAVLETELPLIVDADALNLIAARLVRIPDQKHNWVLTPHPAEAARLLECDVNKIQSNRFEAVMELHQRYGGAIVLKGAGSLVTSEDFSIDITTSGNPGMASGGMGDVLTGVISGLAAQRISLKDAAKIGTFIHSEAADRAAKYGERGMMASDLMGHLRHLVNTPKTG